MADDTARAQGGDRLQRAVTNPGEDEIVEGGRYVGRVPTERALHLDALVRRLGQLEVPPVVEAARAPAQGDPGTGEAQVGSVEVRRVEVQVDRVRHRGDAIEALEWRQGELRRHVELGLDLDLGAPAGGRGHGTSAPRIGT